MVFTPVHSHSPPVKLTREIPGGFHGVRRALLWLRAQERAEGVSGGARKRCYGKYNIRAGTKKDRKLLKEIHVRHPRIEINSMFFQFAIFYIYRKVVDEKHYKI